MVIKYDTKRLVYVDIKSKINSSGQQEEEEISKGYTIDFYEDEIKAIDVEQMFSEDVLENGIRLDHVNNHYKMREVR